jgi:hypothetical protein
MAPLPTPWQALRQRWQAVQLVPADQMLASPCVSRWGMSTPAQQREIWQRLGQRIAQHFNGD